MSNSNNPVNAKYMLSHGDAEHLAAVVLMSSDLRRELLQQYQEEQGSDALLNLFVQFIGLANSVEQNSYARIQSIAVEYLKMPQVDAERLNLPTIFGALDGSGMAVQHPPSGMCGGCAFRRGSIANQCLSTVIDAKGAIESKDEMFLCHENGRSDGKATKLCAGFGHTVKRQKCRKVANVA